MTPKKLWRTSRPRFWVYALGTYILGVAAAMHSHQYQIWWTIPVIVFFVFFTYPANLFTYGVNDIFDYETDLLNPKKVEYESLILPSERKTLWAYIAIVCIPFLLYALLQLQPLTVLSVVCFFILAASYSTPPIRAKARPFWDSIISGLHYVSPGLVGYVLGAGIAGEQISYPICIACITSGFLWSAAMHAFSAVPDIEADKEAKVQTIATKIGKTKTITLCALLYALAALIMVPLLGVVAILIGAIYVAIMLYALKKDTKKIFGIYRVFPILNTIIGMAIFFFILLK